MNVHTRRILSKLAPDPVRASEETINALQIVVDAKLPGDYIQFLHFSNGVEGPLGASNYINLWPAEEILQSTRDSGAMKYAPGLLLIGSNGGNAADGIDLRNETAGTDTYVEMDFTSLDWEEVFSRFSSFDDLIGQLTRT